MSKFSLAEAIRYLNAGFSLLLYLYFLDGGLVGSVVATLGPLGVVGAALAFGSVYYVVYRGVLYNRGAAAAQDLFRRKTDSYRTYLSKKYNLSSAQAIQLYVSVRDRNFPELHKAHDTSIANVHNGYMSGLLAFPVAAAALISGNTSMAGACCLVGLMILIGTFLFERRLQTDELNRLKGLPKEDLDEMARRLFPDEVMSKGVAET